MSALTSSPLAIFAFYAGLNGLLLLVLSFMTSRMRQKTGIVIGDGGNDALIRRIRTHGNSSEYVPITLILIYALATLMAPIWLLHTVGATLTFGRLVFAQGLLHTTKVSPGRVVGMALTWLSLVIASVGVLYFAFI